MNKPNPNPKTQPPKSNFKQVKATPKYHPPTLWPKQIELKDLLVQDLINKGFAIAKVGQRGGKNVLAIDVAAMPLFKNVFLFCMTPDEAFETPFDYTVCLNGRIPKQLAEDNVEAPLAIINEAFWLENSYDLFNELREYAKVLVIGSNGPQFEDQRWQNLGGHSYAAWEINPNLTQAQLIKSTDAHERAKEIRDYGNF